MFLVTLSLYTIFQVQGALSYNLATLLSCRLLTGIFGSSRELLFIPRAYTPDLISAPALTNAGGAVSDIWSFRERGLASAIYATIPFLGPGNNSRSSSRRKVLKMNLVIGPIVGGFVVEDPRLGWHFIFWLMFIFSAVTLITGYFLTPETVYCVSYRN